ncbi:30S ribosomal protein S20 [Candidatus Falkowbacteria bacterium]|nr:30S ribosomal protein S20 [Candidatus Falkowbacteria bacterium]
MPVKRSAFKALRQSKRRAARNKKIKSDISALVRKVNKAISAKDSGKAVEFLKQAIKKFDKAVQNKVIKKNTAARKKSRLSKAVKLISAK